MKIFYITSVLGDSGGSEIYTRDLIKELISRGHELLVFSTEPYEFKGAKVVTPRVFGHHAFHKFQAPFFYFQALKEAKKFKPNLIQSHSNSMMGLIGHFLKRNLKVPHVLLIELITSKNINLHTKTIFFMEKFILPKLNYDKLVVWTKDMEKKFLVPWGISETKIHVSPASLKTKNYPLNIDSAFITKKYGKNLITSIKTLWKTNAQGLKYIIEAMKIVKKKYPQYKYVIFGEGNYKQELVEFTRQKNVEDVVQFAGAIDPKKAKQVMKATEIAPHSYVYEFSTSISLLEYLAMGKACVVTNIGSVKDLVRNAALVVEPNSPKSIANGIIQLIEKPFLRKKLEKRARDLFEKNYSIKSTVDALEKIYLKLT